MALTKKDLEIKIRKVTRDYNTLHANYETIFEQRNGLVMEAHARNDAAAYEALKKMCADLQRQLKEKEEGLFLSDLKLNYDEKQMILATRHHNINTPEAIHELVADSQALNGLFHIAMKMPNIKALIK